MLIMENRMPIAGNTAPEDHTSYEKGVIASVRESRIQNNPNKVYLIRCPLHGSHGCGDSHLVIPECNSDHENTDDENEEDYDEELEDWRGKQKLEKEDVPNSTASQQIHVHNHYHFHQHLTLPSSSTTTRSMDSDICLLPLPVQPSSTYTVTTTASQVPTTSSTVTTTTRPTLISRGITLTTHLQPSLPQSQPPTEPHTQECYRRKAKEFFLAQLQVEERRGASKMEVISVRKIKELINDIENQVYQSVTSQKEYQHMLAKRLARIQMQLSSHHSNRNTRQQEWVINEQVR